MKRIFKYRVPLTSLDINDAFEVVMVRDAEILTVQVQDGRPNMWAIIDDDQPQDQVRRFNVRGTGHAFTGTEGRYIGTFQVAEGMLVFHLFEVPP